MHNTLVSDYDTLGAAGGGTLKLDAGFYQINETINFGSYGNVSIQGAGMGKTILSLPPSPIGTFAADNGSLVGVYNATLNGPSGGVAANFIQLSGENPVDNFEMCDLTVDAQANNASEAWTGSLIFDESGGADHVYSDIAEVGFFGPSMTPNGFHIESSPNDQFPGVGYTIDNLFASNNTLPYENYLDYKPGPNFLNVGAIVNCTMDHVTGIGQVAFEVAPPRGCLIENWNITGHITIDPLAGGSWGGTLFENVNVTTNTTVASIALGSQVPTDPQYEASNFTALRWLDDHFYGSVVGGANLVDIENSTFDGELNSTPAIFKGNTVTWTRSSPQRLSLPILIEGLPAGGTSSVVSGNTFLFPNGTGKGDPLQLTVPVNTWSNDTVEVAGPTSGYLLEAPEVSISENSSFSRISYDSLGNNSPSNLVLVDIAASPDFQDLGASVGSLTRVTNDLPSYIPTAPSGFAATAKSPTEVGLSWGAASGPVTNYTVLVGDRASALDVNHSVGLRTEYTVDGLAPESTHFFAVEAWNYSFHSAITVPVETTTPGAAPGEPAGLAVTDIQSAAVGLRWSPPTGAVTNYTVYVGLESSKLVPEISAGNVTDCMVAGLTPDTTYYLAVEAWNGPWASDRSSSMAVTTLPVDIVPRAPGAPAGLGVVSRGIFDIGLSWNAPAATVTNYTVYMGDSASTLIPQFSAGNGTNFTVTGLEPATTYFFAVQAWNGSLGSERSAPINATCLPVPISLVPGSAGINPMTASDWAIVFGTMLGTFGAVILVLVCSAFARTAARTRGRARALGRHTLTGWE